MHAIRLLAGAQPGVECRLSVRLEERYTLHSMDPMQRCGATFRAVRIKRRWRQVDLARRAGVHRSVISNIERGHLEGVAIGTLIRVARALEIHVSFTTRWRGGDLDRMLSAKHAGLHEAVARWFSAELPEWILAPEVSYSINGERGVIDILAWHPGRRALLVIELKTDIVDVNELVGSMDRRRRLAWHRSGPGMGSPHRFNMGPCGGWPHEPCPAASPQDDASERISDRRSGDGRMATPSRFGGEGTVALGAERFRTGTRDIRGASSRAPCSVMKR